MQLCRANIKSDFVKHRLLHNILCSSSFSLKYFLEFSRYPNIPLNSFFLVFYSKKGKKKKKRPWATRYATCVSAPLNPLPQLDTILKLFIPYECGTCHSLFRYVGQYSEHKEMCHPQALRCENWWSWSRSRQGLLGNLPFCLSSHPYFELWFSIVYI